MGINTDLNIGPYFDDYDETNQYNRVLFKPARAVQARELTQLQTILQNQVERFGSNIYKEGTVIAGVNITQRDDIQYVKLRDTSNFPDPTIYRPSEDTSFYLLGESSGLRAEIVWADNGFETRLPDLKTFYVKYLNTIQSANNDVKQYEQGEIIKIVDENDTPIQEPNGPDDMTVVAASVQDHVGRSFGVSVNEGIIYQKGHFIFTEDQFVIVSKYTNIPNDVSIGFNVEENIITSSQDQTLLDNAQGFNNFNAPGADRLQLKPILVSYASGEEPDDFFSIIRFERGLAAAIRDVTQFNSISTEMARRTYEESGNYIVRGMNISLDKDANNTYAVVDSGKAYSFGYEINNISKKFLPLEPSSGTLSQDNQTIGIDYGSYYEFVWGSFSGEANNDVLTPFTYGISYNMVDAGSNIIGSCTVRNVVPGVDGSKLGRIYVYEISRVPGEENTPVARIQDTPVLPTLKESNRVSNIYNAGKDNLFSANNIRFTRRIRKSVGGGTTIVLEQTAEQTPLTSNIYAVDATNNLISCTATPTANSTVTVTLDASDATILYHDVIETGVDADDLTEVDFYVNTTYDASEKVAYIGAPNVVKVFNVFEVDENGTDVTDKFRLVNNQQDGYYGISYLKLKSGETAPANNSLLVYSKAIRRTSTAGDGGFLSINSYNNVNTGLIQPYTTKTGEVYDLTSSYDFRPYVSPWVAYETAANTAETATDPGFTTLLTDVSPSVEGFITGDIEFYLSRIDNVVIDSTGAFDIIQGSPSENPVATKTPNSFQIGEVFVPGNNLDITGSNAVKVKQKVVRNYTMEEIGKIDQRVDRLSDIVSLSLLEQETNDLFIPDANGLNRFKNGILVDSFTNLDIADIADAEYSSAIDRGYRVSMPRIRQFPIDLKFKEGTNVNSGYEDVITISDTGQIRSLISQPFATNVRNAVSNFYNYNGKAIIEPQFDSGYNVIQNPAINFEVDIATPLADLVDNLQEFLPLTQTEVDRVVTDVRRTGSRLRTTTRTTTSVNSLSADSISRSTENVGSFVTDIAFNPYMQSREIKILVTGLRPNTRHYFYFDEEDVNSNVRPGRIEPLNGGSVYSVNDVQISGQMGAVVRSDSNGVLAAVFTIPENTFFVGEVDLEIADVSDYTSIQSGKTSYSRISYRAYNFGVGKSNLSATTRSVDFDTTTTVTTNNNTTTRFIPNFGGTGGRETTNDGDPISQTFFVKGARAQGANSIFVNQILLYFQTKSPVNGVTVELREVSNGYPSSIVLPFGKKHLTPSEINTSGDGTTSTTITFDNPVKLSIEKEYAFVVIPDANDPDYLLYTSKVGGVDLATGKPVTQDWGDGVLFTSTNNRAWQSYQDEDLKFEVRRLEFTDTTETPAFADLVPNNVEFFNVSSVVNPFRNDEIAYKKTATVYSGVGIEGREVTVALASVDFNVGDYILLEQGANDFISYVTSVNSAGAETVITMRGSNTLDESVGAAAVDATLIVSGRVTFFNNRKADRLYLKESSARATARFEVGDSVIGYESGATATIDSITDETISYMQPLVLTDNTIKTKTELDLLNGSTVERPITADNNVYLTGAPRKVPSRSNITSGASSEDFAIRVNMKNLGFQTISPTIDSKISILNAYQYLITDDEETTSKYLSKEIVLQDDMEAAGLKVLLSGYRPAGTVIDVYARFRYETNPEVQSDWVQLVNQNPETYSALTNIRDYRQYEYNLTDETNEFNSFQMKIVMRHMTSAEKTDSNVTATTDINLFPHVYDYRSIALT